MTILERGVTSTRWRDYIDIVQLAAKTDLDAEELLASARAVARYRQVTLEPVAPHIEGYGAISQAKWAAWRRKEGVQSISEESLDAQMAKVSEVVDPVFVQGPAAAPRAPRNR